MLVTPGQVVAERFEVQRHIGAGGMGAVYRAHDRDTNGLVALKLVGCADVHTSARFEREANALAQLVHPRIVGYLAHGRSDDVLYLAMEWLDGEDLGTRLEVGKLTVAEAIACISQAAAALAVAHARGVVHRDVKPSNLFLVNWQPDQVKLLDFGIARFLHLDALTRTGALVGTPLYMAPEQLTGQDIDARTDVFALGAVMFHALTGRPPFPARNLPELVAKVTAPEDAPRVRTLAPHVPAPLDELVARMLAKDPARRPHDGAAVRAALEAGGIHDAAAAIATAETGIVDPRPARTTTQLLGDGRRALEEGRWQDARDAFERALAVEDSIEARLGLADVLPWLGEPTLMIEHLETVYARLRRGDSPEAVMQAAAVALRLALTYKKMISNSVACRGWLARAVRLLGDEPGPLAPFLFGVQAIESTDPARAVELNRKALELARAANDRDNEIVSMGWLGYSLVGNGELDEGMALVDEAMAAVLGREYKQLDTVVGTTCAMVNACDEAADMQRMQEWVSAVDPFFARYGCPLLFADCRWHYGSALIATGKWDDAERELTKAINASKPETDYHLGAVGRLGELHVRRGRLDDAQALAGKLGDHPVGRRLAGAIMHARGEHGSATVYLQRFLDACGPSVLQATSAMDLMIDACIASGNLAMAQAVARRLEAVATKHQSKLVLGHVAFALGRCALAADDHAQARNQLERAVELFAGNRLPHDAARARLALAQTLAGHDDELARLEARSASQAFEQLGATRDATLAADLLRTLGA